jgi:hypothetical protein
MLRCPSVLLVVPAFALALALTGCLGGSTPNSGGGGVKSISLNPGGNTSIEIGGTQIFTASALDANNKPIIGADIQLVVTSPPGSGSAPPLSMTSSGTACAGTWDATQSACSPGSPGVALVTAVANGVSSAPATVYVHMHIASLQLAQAETKPPAYDCFSQGQTWLYEATAYDTNGADITGTIGQPNWSATNTGVITANPNPSLPIPLPLNQVQITAVSPGVTNLYASLSGTTSNSVPITTCLVQSIRLQVSGTTQSSVNVSSGSTVALQATVLDTLGNVLSRPPLTWLTSNPEVASFTSPATTTGANSATAHSNAGGTAISAACTPPTCNIGVLPGIPLSSAMPDYVFASDGPASPIDPLQAYGVLSVSVTNTTAPTYSAWAATRQCGDTTSGCTSVMFSVTPTTSGGTNPIGAIITLPRTPNSMMFNHQSRIYLGSDQGLMYWDVGGTGGTANLVSPVSTPCNVALCGMLLATSGDGKQVVVADTVSSTPQVYIYNAGNNPGSVTDLILPTAATAAAFSPDQSKIFILTGDGLMYVYSTVNALAPVTLPSSASSGTGVVFSADGSFAYVAGSSGASGSVSAFSTCALTGEPSVDLLGPGGSVATAGVPMQIFPSPSLQHANNRISQNIYVFEPPNVQVLTAQFAQVSNNLLTQPTKYFCNAPNLSSFSITANYTLPGGQFTPVYANLVNNGSELIVVARFIPSVLIFSDGTNFSVPLINSYDPRWASASDDGSLVFVAACDRYPNNDRNQPCAAGSVHIVNTLTGNDQQVPFVNNTTDNMCNGQGAGAPICFPDLIAVKPQ